MSSLANRPMHIWTAATIPESPPTAASSPRSSVPELSYSSSEPDLDAELFTDLTPTNKTKNRRASTILLSKNADDVRRLLGEDGTKLAEACCGGGCCMSASSKTVKSKSQTETIQLPDNTAFQSLQINFGKDLRIEIPTVLTGVPELPKQTVEVLPLKNRSRVPSPRNSVLLPNGNKEDEVVAVDFTPHPEGERKTKIDTSIHPPSFVQPHAPYETFSAKVYNARELTRPGAEKRTFHFDLDVTDYPEETGVDFKVGGAIGVLAPNNPDMVDELMDLLCIPKYMRDRDILLKTSSGRWPTVWGDDMARELVTTRRALLTWCTDIQSYPPSKPFLKLLAHHAASSDEKKLLNYLISNEGQGLFCDLRTGPHLTVPQILHAFPSSKPPLDALLSVLTQLMPRFYSLSNDPHEECEKREGCRRLIEIAVTVHETASWTEPGAMRTGVGSGFFERQALKFIAAAADRSLPKPDLRIPVFKGLMANPLAREFAADGPMLLIGAGVGVAPFRSFMQRRLKSANCANKVWLIQGVRDASKDELYVGEWGDHEHEMKEVVESRRGGSSRYVQDEIIRKADLVWDIISNPQGKVYVCGSSKGMGEGVERALKDVAISEGNMSEEQAAEFWKKNAEAGQYIAETW